MPSTSFNLHMLTEVQAYENTHVYILMHAHLHTSKWKKIACHLQQEWDPYLTLSSTLMTRMGEVSQRAFPIGRKFDLQKGKLNLNGVKYFSEVTEKISRKARIQTQVSAPSTTCFPSPQMRPDHGHHTQQWIRTLERLGDMGRMEACLTLSYLSEALERGHQKSPSRPSKRARLEQKSGQDWGI